MKYILVLFLALPYCSYSNNASDTLSLERKIENIYEYLHDRNEENDLHGRSEENLYVIDPDLFEFNWDAGGETWVTTFAAKTSLPVIQSLNQRLQEFNNSRRGVDVNTGKPKDGLAMYIIFCSRFYVAYLKDEIEELPEVHWVNTQTDFEKYFTEENTKKILYYKGEFDKLVNRVRASMIRKYPLTMLYAYGSMIYALPRGGKGVYPLTRFSIDFIPTDGLSDEQKMMMSRVSSLEEKIYAKANLSSIKMSKTEGAYVKTTVESLIAAVGSVVDGGDMKSKPTAPECKAIQTWPLKADEYAKAVETVATARNSVNETAQTQVVTDNYVIYENRSPIFIEMYASKEAFPDRLFIVEKLPELLALMNSYYKITVLFGKVDVLIPESERRKFAEDVAKLVKPSEEEILIVVPYYTCNVSRAAEEAKSVILMPSVYSKDQGLNESMNEAFRTQSNFTDGFNLAFKNIPKDHTVFIGTYLWNGQLVYKEETQKNVTGFANLADVYTLIDTRIDLIQPFMNCKSVLREANKPFHDESGSKTPVVNESYGPYLECLKDNSQIIRNLIASTSKVTYKELEPGNFNIRQSELLGEDGTMLALTYIHALTLKHVNNFFVNGEAGSIDIDDSFLDDSHFYYKDNPVHRDSWGRTVVDVGSFLLGFLGPVGTLYDGVAAWVYYMTGDYDSAMTFAGSAVLGLVIPEALERSGEALLKKYQMLRKIEKEGIFDAVAGKNYWVRSEAKVLEAKVADKGLFISPGLTKEVNGAMIAAGVEKEVIKEMTKAVTKKVESALVETEGGIIKSKLVSEGIGAYEIRNAANDRNIIKRFAEALEAKPALTFEAFLDELKASPSFFNLSGMLSGMKLREEANWLSIVIGKINNGKIIYEGQEMTTKELAAYLRNKQWKGKPIRIVSAVGNNVDELKHYSSDLAKELDTKTKTHIGEIKVSAEGEIASVVGGEIDWAISNYAAIPDFKNVTEMLRDSRFAADQRTERIFTIVPEVIQPDGNVICRINGALKSYTPRSLAEDMTKEGLRADESIFIAIQNTDFLDQNYENIAELAKLLEKETGNSVRYANKATLTFDKQQYRFIDATDLVAIGPLKNDEVYVLGERKVTLFTEKNFKVNDVDGNIYVTVEGFTDDGKKIRVYRQQTKKVEEVTAEQFFKDIQAVEKNTLHGKDIAGKPIRIIPVDGVNINQSKIRPFLEDLSQKTKAKIQTPKTAVKALEGSSLPVAGVSWMTHSPMEEGLYFLQKKINDNVKFSKLLDDYEEAFANQLGLALSENNGKYLADFLKSENYDTWLTELSSYYKSYNKVSIPTYYNIKSISARLSNKELPEALIKDLYNNANYAKKLDEQLKWLNADDVKKIVDDEDLFNEVVQFVESETLTNGSSLVGFMATRKLKGKLTDSMIAEITRKYGNNESFIIFLADQIDKNLSGSVLEKFKLYEAYVPDFLQEFYTRALKRASNPYDPVDLALYVLRFQQKNQMNLAGNAVSTFTEAADRLVPQEGYFDVILKTNGKNFIVNGKELTPRQTSKLIKANPDCEDKQLRFLIDGDQAQGPAQQLLQELQIDGKVNPAGKYAVTHEGRLYENWIPLRYEAPQIFKQEDAALLLISKLMKKDPRYVYVYIHGDWMTFAVVLANGDGIVVTNLSVVDWALKQDVFVQALKDGKDIMLISCCAAASDMARQFSERLAEIAREIDSPIHGLFPSTHAPDVPYGFNQGVEGTPLTKGGKWQSFKDGQYVGPMQGKEDIKYFGPIVEDEAATAASKPPRPVFYPDWDEKTKKLLITILDEGEVVELGYAYLQDGWITGPFLYTKKGGNGRWASGEDVWDRIFTELVARNGGRQPLGIKAELMEDNFAWWKRKYEELKASHPDRDDYELKVEAIWLSHGGKMALRSGYNNMIDITFKSDEVWVTFIP